MSSNYHQNVNQESHSCLNHSIAKDKNRSGSWSTLSVCSSAIGSSLCLRFMGLCQHESKGHGQELSFLLFFRIFFCFWGHMLLAVSFPLLKYVCFYHHFSHSYISYLLSFTGIIFFLPLLWVFPILNLAWMPHTCRELVL